MKKIVLLYILLGVQLLVADPLFVESQTVHYLNDDVILNGDVKVEHSLGMIRAQRVQLLQNETNERRSLNAIHLKDHVKILLKEGGELACDYAEINCKTFTGTFTSGPFSEVAYQEENPIPLLIKARQMNLELCRENKEWCVNKIEARQNLSVYYNNTYTAFGELLTYCRYQVPISQKIEGRIFLEASEGQLCHVKTLDGDYSIKAENIWIDTQKRESFFTQPRGEIKSKGEVEFSADKMIWDDSHNALSLEGNVIINQAGIGNLTNENKVMLHRENFEGKNQISTMMLPGKSVLTYEDAENPLYTHTLTCYGNLIVDRKNFKIIASSPLDDHGQVIQDKQIHYIDPVGEIYADEFTITYAQKPGKMEVSQIIFKGNVYICNQNEAATDDLLKQYIVADTVKYYPGTREMNLEAAKGKRVLFYDKIDNLQVSAPALKIKRNIGDKKESVQGFGDVRFNFIEHEFDKLKSRFLLDREQKR